MNQLFGDPVDVCKLVFLDNILILSYTEGKYQKHIHMVFDRLAQLKYYVKHKKCERFSEKVEFLAIPSRLLVLVLSRTRLILSSSGYSQNISRMYRLS